MSAEKKTASEAQQYCDKEMNANLVKINSQQENNFVLDLVNEHAPSVNQIWIGLRLKYPFRKFYWYDHSVPTFKSWAPGEPNGKSDEPCAAMFVGRAANLPKRASGYWNDLRCNVQFATVCKKLY